MCLEEFFKAEVIDDFKCEKCHKKGRVYRQTKIYKAPKILVQSFKRFDFHKYSGYNEKIDNKVKLVEKGAIISRDHYYHPELGNHCFV